MGMQLNIDSDEAYGLASRLSELTGQSMASAVTDALRERLANEEAALAREKLKADIRAITAEIHAELDQAGGEPLTSNHDWLYDDETGLPI